MPNTDNPQKSDRRYMRLALAQAKKGLGRSSPNPAVGAVVVKDGRVVGKGYHAKAGTPHAEVHALAMAGELAKDADIFVTLEPCHHAGRTPPCTRAILEAGIKRVVFGASDPNPKVAGGGGDFLRSKGLEVVEGVLGDACRDEHRFFFTHITRGRPHVLLKTAATLDGKTASRTGHSQWVTGPKARQFVHRLRNGLDAICVGIGTAKADDPSLTCRGVKGGRDPVRLVVDTSLRLSPDSKVINPESAAPCLVACGPEPKAARLKALEAAGAEVICLPLWQGRVDLAALLAELGRRGITSLLLEGGADLAWGFAQRGLVDEVMYFFAPKLIGGRRSPGMLGGEGFEKMDQALMLGEIKVRRFGPDLMLRAMVAR